IRRTTAMAIRRTTATETGIISATTPDVTDERLPAPITEHGRGKPRALLFCASLRPQLLTGIRLQFAPFYNSYFSLTTTRRHAITFPPSLIEGRLRRHPEGGARSGVLRRRLVTAGLGRPGPPPARHYDLAARSSLHGSEGNCPPLQDGGRPRRRKRGPGAQNRHGGAPRGERPASWDARRLARRLAYHVTIRPRVPRTHPNVSRRSAHPSEFG